MSKEQDKLREEEKISNRLDVLTDVATGKMNWQDSIATINKVATKDPELAEAMTANLEKGEYLPKEVKNEDFMTLAKNIFSSNDSKTIGDFLVTTLRDNKNISVDKLGILTYVAKQRIAELQLQAEKQKEPSRKENTPPKRGFWDSAFDIAISGNPITAPFVLSNTIKRAQNENAQGEQLLKIANDEKRKQTLIDNPNRTRYQIGDIITNPKNGKSGKVVGYREDGTPQIELKQ